MIHLLFTGGTISMQYDAVAGGNVPTHEGEALLALAPDAAAIAPCRVENWARVPACHFSQHDHWRLRQRVDELRHDATVQGIVVTHGTDTLEETAYLLDRTLNGDTPVVCTGAMRTSDHAEWDGSRNLTDAIRVAASEPSRGRGTQVVFNGRIWQGREAVKVNTVALDAFGAPFGGQRGSVTMSVARSSLGKRHRVDAVSYAGAAVRTATVSPRGLSARVALVPIVIGDRGELLDAVRGAHDGVVVEAFGSGNLPPGAVPAIGRWLEQGKPVILSSRCAAGRVSPVYAFEGGGARTVALGVTPAGPRTPSQARWELTIALSAGVPYASGLSA